MPKRVLSVGQCVPDNAALAGLLNSHFEVEIAQSALPDDTLAALNNGSFDLVLINRKLDADYSDGIEILRTIKADADLRALPVMLVSNLPESQQEAVSAGAEPGFGKLEFDSPRTVERLTKFLG